MLSGGRVRNVIKGSLQRSPRHVAEVVHLGSDAVHTGRVACPRGRTTG
jgi:hypothetical protein